MVIDPARLGFEPAAAAGIASESFGVTPDAGSTGNTKFAAAAVIVAETTGAPVAGLVTATLTVAPPADAVATVLNGRPSFEES